MLMRCGGSASSPARCATVRVVARLGAEKGVTGLLASSCLMPGRQTEVVLASAGFEAAPGSQAGLLVECQALAAAAGAVLLPALAWREVPGFLAGAAVTIVPSARETFGNLALESLSVGTPVIAHATGNLVRAVLPPRRSARSRCWSAVSSPSPRKRTVCGMLTGAVLFRAWPHDRAHFFFSRARWNPDDRSRGVRGVGHCP